MVKQSENRTINAHGIIQCVKFSCLQHHVPYKQFSFSVMWIFNCNFHLTEITNCILSLSILWI